MRVDLVAWLASDERALDTFAQAASNGMFWYLQASPFYPDPAFLRHLKTHYDMVEDRGFHLSQATLYRINTPDSSRRGAALP